ncbi:sensor histidine kinase [Propionicicella superfundia]|uniref:sensor histidine kinase n=1 Tax=Propionicicella superfundia TaxID=348582 RepID=UPI0004268962|nr:HAMP domain-containing sensor histidine kinase [Propionicicella superfundia]
MTSAPPPALGRGTLGRKLVLQVAVLVALGTVLLGLLTSVTTYQVMVSELDDRLDSTFARITRDNPENGTQPPGAGVGQQIGTVAVEIDSTGTATAQGRLTDDGWVSLNGDDVTALMAARTTTAKQNADLPGLGLYRVRVSILPTGGAIVVGLPMKALTETMTTVVVTQAVLIIATVTISVLIARTIVVRSLRPLNRLAAAATTVSQLNLERGEVSIGTRVSEADADPHTEVGSVGKAFNLMLDNVENALAVRQESETRVRQFVADASHELRNPLASIRGYAELTRRDRDSNTPDTRYALERIESESDRMSELVNDLLLLARLDTGPAIERSEVDASEIVINAVADARAAGPDHDWTFSAPDEPVFLAADGNRLHQIVANLLTNARTHTPAGTKVHTSVAATPETVEIRVTDDGPGIPPEILGRVFERFMRGEASRVRTSGSSTGLGLAIVKAVVRAHGGTVGVESEPGVRTSFIITLPRSAPDTTVALL